MPMTLIRGPSVIIAGAKMSVQILSMPMSRRLALLQLSRSGCCLWHRPGPLRSGAWRYRLPPITWACPMNGTHARRNDHADVKAEKANCPICKMALVAVRLDSIWTCPVHSVIAEKQAGRARSITASSCA